MTPDRFTTTEADALRYERHYAGDPYPDRPTLAECERDEAWLRGERE